MKTNKKRIISENYAIPVEGSLGLLALGAVGLREWRKVKKQAQENLEKENDKSIQKNKQDGK